MKTALSRKTTALCAALLLIAHCAPAAEEAKQTVIDSDSLEMTAGDAVNSFRFTGKVHAVGQGMLLTCDTLDVIARREAGKKGTIGKMSSVQSIVAQGNVRMEQAGRIAEAGRAEVLPDQGLVILSDNPSITDSKAKVEGWKIIYNSRDKTAQVLPTPEEHLLPGQSRTRSRVTIDENAIPKLDYEQVLGAEPPKTAEPEKASDSQSPQTSAQPESK